MDAIDLPMNVEFSIHAAALAIQRLDRDELEEAFIEILDFSVPPSTSLADSVL